MCDAQCHQLLTDGARRAFRAGACVAQNVHHFPALGLTRARRTLGTCGSMGHRLNAALYHTTGCVAAPGRHTTFNTALFHGVLMTKLLIAS